MKVSFARGQWSMDDFTQITSFLTDGRLPFTQEDDCVVNDIDKGRDGKYNYISILAKEELHVPCVIETECEFDFYGAPLIVISDDIKPTEDGYPGYGHHFETVAFEEGFNIWDLNANILHKKAAMGRFPVPGGEKIKLRLEVREKKLIVTLMGNTMEFDIDDVPETFRAGITACEGVNRFYTFETKQL